MNLRHHLRYLVIAFTFAFGPSAFAHPGHLHPGEDEIDEFEQGRALLTGLQHPLSSWEHWLPLLVTGCAAGLASRRQGRTVISFLAGTAVGGLVGTAGIAVSGFSMIAVAGSIVAASLSLAPGKAPTNLLALVAGVIGFYQGNAQFFKVPLLTLLPAYGSGFVLAGSSCLLLGLFVGRLVRSKPRLRAETYSAVVS